MNDIYTGPPLPPHPTFRVVNATHIEVKWDKPYANPEFDIQSYTLTIINMRTNTTEVHTYMADTTYPIRHLVNNGGDISNECHYVRFNVTATNVAGTSQTGSVVGSFPSKSTIFTNTTCTSEACQ